MKYFEKLKNLKCLCLTVILLSAGRMQAQSPDSVLVMGEEYHLFSDVLNENRPYWVHLPADYAQHPEKQYPVLYLLDGEQNFVTAVGIHAFLNRGPRAQFPEVIIVGISNTDRTRDLTPTPAVSTKGAATMENSGGGPRFLEFLSQELIPLIEARYRTSDRRVLIGHSFGALFAVYTLLNHPEVFTDYLALDPSFWWDDQQLLRDAGSRLSSLDLKNVRLYWARAGAVVQRPGTAPATEDARQMQTTLQDQLAAIPTNLKWKYQDFPEETHGSIFLMGTYSGLKFLFESN